MVAGSSVPHHSMANSSFASRDSIHAREVWTYISRDRLILVKPSLPRLTHVYFREVHALNTAPDEDMSPLPATRGAPSVHVDGLKFSNRGCLSRRAGLRARYGSSLLPRNGVVSLGEYHGSTSRRRRGGALSCHSSSSLHGAEMSRCFHSCVKGSICPVSADGEFSDHQLALACCNPTSLKSA